MSWREKAKEKGLDEFDLAVIELVVCLAGELPSVCEEPIEGEEEWDEEDW